MAVNAIKFDVHVDGNDYHATVSYDKKRDDYNLLISGDKTIPKLEKEQLVNVILGKINQSEAEGKWWSATATGPDSHDDEKVKYSRIGFKIIGSEEQLDSALRSLGYLRADQENISEGNL